MLIKITLFLDCHTFFLL